MSCTCYYYGLKYYFDDALMTTQIMVIKSNNMKYNTNKAYLHDYYNSNKAVEEHWNDLFWFL